MLKPTPTTIRESRASRPALGVTRGILRWIEHGLALFGAIVALFLLTLDLSVVVSPSMAPALKGTNYSNGDRVLTEKVSRWFRRPRRWEVVTYLNDEGIRVMKRVVGLPGETVQINRAGGVLINGQAIENPNAPDRKYLAFGNVIADKSAACGDGYYVLGDDTKDSDDSRFNGPVTSDRIVGRAWLIVAPWSRFGFVVER